MTGTPPVKTFPRAERLTVSTVRRFLVSFAFGCLSGALGIVGRLIGTVMHDMWQGATFTLLAVAGMVCMVYGLKGKVGR